MTRREENDEKKRRGKKERENETKVGECRKNRRDGLLEIGKGEKGKEKEREGEREQSPPLPQSLSSELCRISLFSQNREGGKDFCRNSRQIKRNVRKTNSKQIKEI